MVSLSLILSMLLSVCIPVSATNIEPKDSRHRTVVVEDPEWTYICTRTVTRKEAANQNAYQQSIGIVLATFLVLSEVPVLAGMVAEIAYVWASSGTTEEQGQYTIERKYRTTYSENMLTGARHVTRKQVLFKVTFNDEEPVIKTFTLR